MSAHSSEKYYIYFEMITDTDIQMKNNKSTDSHNLYHANIWADYYTYFSHDIDYKCNHLQTNRVQLRNY